MKLFSESILFIFSILFSVSNCENILFLCGIPSRSHHLWNGEIVKALAARGHNLTVLSTDFDLKSPENVQYLVLNDVYATIRKNFTSNVFESARESNPFRETFEYFKSTPTLCECEQ